MYKLWKLRNNLPYRCAKTGILKKHNKIPKPRKRNHQIKTKYSENLLEIPKNRFIGTTMKEKLKVPNSKFQMPNSKSTIQNVRKYSVFIIRFGLGAVAYYYLCPLKLCLTKNFIYFSLFMHKIDG